MVKKGTPRYWGSSSYQPRRGRGTAEPPSARARIARYWVENSASRKSRCLVGATRTTRRCSAAAGRAGPAEDGLVGEPVGAGGLRRRRPRGREPSRRLGGQPAREDGGHLVGVALADVGHGAALYRRRGRRGVGPDSVARVLIVIDLSEARVYLREPDDFTRFSVAVEGDGDLARVVRRVRPRPPAARRRARGGRPGGPAGAGGARRHRGVGRGLRRHVRVRRRKGLGGGRRRRPRPYRATRRGRLSQPRVRRPRRRCGIGRELSPAPGAATLEAPPGTTGGGGAGPLSSWGGRMAIRDYDRLFIGGDWVAPEGTDTIDGDLAVDRGGRGPGARRHRGRHRQGRGRGAHRVRPRAVAPHDAGRAGDDPGQGGGADHGRDGRHGRDHHAGDGLAHLVLGHGPGAGARR